MSKTFDARLYERRIKCAYTAPSNLKLRGIPSVLFTDGFVNLAYSHGIMTRNKARKLAARAGFAFRYGRGMKLIKQADELIFDFTV